MSANLKRNFATLSGGNQPPDGGNPRPTKTTNTNAEPPPPLPNMNHVAALLDARHPGESIAFVIPPAVPNATRQVAIYATGTGELSCVVALLRGYAQEFQDGGSPSGASVTRTRARWTPGSRGS